MVIKHHKPKTLSNLKSTFILSLAFEFIMVQHRHVYKGLHKGERKETASHPKGPAAPAPLSISSPDINTYTPLPMPLKI